MGERVTFDVTIEIIQDSLIVASVTGRKDDAERQAAHYVLIYGQDGPVEMRTKRKAQRNPR